MKVIKVSSLFDFVDRYYYLKNKKYIIVSMNYITFVNYYISYPKITLPLHNGKNYSKLVKNSGYKSYYKEYYLFGREYYFLGTTKEWRKKANEIIRSNKLNIFK